ncbi:hypothetical protein ACXR2U_10995 [Jatrophihabitans sp. YIM 134969]
MHAFTLWVGFVGAWFLVMGPLRQAAGELHEQDLDREALAEAGRGVVSPPRVSDWWWLVPPVKYLRERRRNQAFRRAVFEALGPEDRAAFVDYMNKATGWLLVAVGGTCIAGKETWELLDHYEQHVWLWLVVMGVLGVAAAAFAAASVGRGDQMKGSPRRRPSRRTG